jgi:hypothetical protein
MKIALVLLGLFSQVVWSSTRIQNFTIVRSGGGQIEILVSAKYQDRITAVTKSCSYKKLSKDEQRRSTLVLKGKDKKAARIIFNNEAVIIPKDRTQGATGSWSSVKLNYEFTAQDGTVTFDTKEISDPEVTINSKKSEILSDIEDQVREATKELCE